MKQEFKDFLNRALEDIKIELDDEFDKNFERKAFFREKWQERRFDDGNGSLLVRSGGLRRSINSKRRGMELIYGSPKPYGRIHNEGGKIKVTAKMKGFFWYKYKKAAGKRRGKNLSDKAEFYRAMALKKVGSDIIIPERRFIGPSRETDRIIRQIAQENIEEFFKHIKITDK